MTKQILIGKVVSVKMLKTVVVEVERKVQHPVYKKIIRKTNKFKADTNGLDLNLGQSVKIQQAKPMSKDKKFIVTEIVKEGGRK